MDLNTSGKRVLYARNLACLTRGDFCKKHKIPVITLRSWEASVRIKEKAAKRFSEAIKKEGVYCDHAWVMYGVGYAPHAFGHYVADFSKIVGGEFDERMAVEVDHLKKTYENVVHRMVGDASMFPFLCPGDYVAGYHTTESDQCIGSPCIIEIDGGQSLVRVLNESKDRKAYDLTALNPAALMYNMSLLKKDVKSVAKIFWTRKR